MRHHELKIDPGTLNPIIQGVKPFDVRRDDRTFMPGDTILFRETRQSGEYMKAHVLEPEYTGKKLAVRITFVLRGPCYGVPVGLSVLGLQSMDPRPNDPQNTHGPFPGLLYKAIEKLGGQSDILTIVGSWGDTLSDEDCASMLREWLEHSEPAGLQMFHSPGAEAICQERRRQVEQEGFDAEHDEQHRPGVLAQAAAYYCRPYNIPGDSEAMFPGCWDDKWAKREGFPFPSRRDMEKAGALCAAALDLMGWED